VSKSYQDGQAYRRGKRVKKWKGRLRLYYQDGSVKRPEVVLGLCSEMSKSEARTKLREMILQNGGRPSPVLHDITFGEYWRDHYVPLRRTGWSEPTEAGYNGYMKYLILPTFEHIALKDIDHVFLANYFAGLRNRCAYWAMKKIRTLLKSIFEEAVNDDLVGKNPMRRIPRPNTADPDKPVLEKADAAKVLKAMGDDKSKTGTRDYAMTRIGTFCAVRSAEVFGLRWECDLGKDLFVKHSAWEGKLYERHTKKAKPRKVAVDKRTRQALDNWKENCPDTNPEALMFPSDKPSVPFTSRNWIERDLQPIGKKLGIRTPLTFQVLRRSFATHNQRQLKNVQAHLGHESTGTTADLYVVEIPAEVRRTQERYAAEIEALGRPKKSAKDRKKHLVASKKSVKLDATGRKLSKGMSVSC
jgi:integrase